jgi:hypothetical protein
MRTILAYRRELRLAAILAAAAAAMGAAMIARAAILTDNLLVLSETFFAAGGGGPDMTGGGVVLADTIGGPHHMTMSGGGLSLTPGGVGIPPLAAPDFSFVHAFPTPFEPSKGHDRITFRGLPPNVTIKIYTVTGQFVKTLSKHDPQTQDLVWKPVENESGRPLSSGVYFYQVSGDNGRASGKLMVIK